jgi:hypothetical protein
LERVVAGLGGIDHHAQALDRFVLPCEFFEERWTQRDLKCRIDRIGVGGFDSWF